jgi:actin related protein 2/3 complex subunit 3
MKDLTTLALSQAIPIPGEPSFPMNAMFKAPANKMDEGKLSYRFISVEKLQLIFISETMRAYLQQLRQEVGLRLLDRVFDQKTDKPSKVSDSFLAYSNVFGRRGKC